MEDRIVGRVLDDWLDDIECRIEMLRPVSFWVSAQIFLGSFAVGVVTAMLAGYMSDRFF